MTAIKSTNYSGDVARHARESSVPERSVPQHVSSPSTPLTSSSKHLIDNNFAYSSDLSDPVALAKSRFAQAVSQGVSELVSKGGYSRERATALLLRNIKRDESSPDDHEVLRLMRSAAIGLNDAFTALTVARAVRRARIDRDLNASEAIDELTAKLNTDLLLSDNAPICPSALLCYKKENDPLEITPEERLGDTKRVENRTPSPLLLSPLMSDMKKNHTKFHSKDGKAKGQQNITKKPSLKVASRKRAFTDDISSAQAAISPTSMIHSKPDKENSVDLDVAAKEKLVTEDKVIAKDSVVRNKSSGSTVLRTKRAVSHVDGGNELLLQQTPRKRPRV